MDEILVLDMEENDRRHNPLNYNDKKCRLPHISRVKDFKTYVKCIDTICQCVKLEETYKVTLYKILQYILFASAGIEVLWGIEFPMTWTNVTNHWLQMYINGQSIFEFLEELEKLLDEIDKKYEDVSLDDFTQRVLEHIWLGIDGVKGLLTRDMGGFEVVLRGAIVNLIDLEIEEYGEPDYGEEE